MTVTQIATIGAIMSSIFNYRVKHISFDLFQNIEFWLRSSVLFLWQ